MDEEELNEIFELLRSSGMEPMLCDTPVHLSSLAAPCGSPEEMTDDFGTDYVMIPKKLLGSHPVIYIPIVGDSMINIGIEPDDTLRVNLGQTPRDGDTVVASIDGRSTVKSFYTDKDGFNWLVPQNENYDAIKLTEDMDVRIIGVVVGVEKSAPRATAGSMTSSISLTKKKLRAAQHLSEDALDEMIVRISDYVLHARQWYAVYRALLDRDALEDTNINYFAERVKRLLPHHKHLPEGRELSRMAVYTFAKPVCMWNEASAPVRGTRFHDYLKIAIKMGRFLAGDE